MAAAGRNGPHGEPFIWIWRHSRPPALLLRPGTPSCSNCRHGHCRHHVNVDCCNPRRGRLLFDEMPIGSIFSRRPSVLSLASEMRPIGSAFARSEWVCVLYYSDVSSQYHSVYRTHTHSLLAKADLIGQISLASDRTDGRQEKMLPLGISATRRRPQRILQQSTLTTTVGARRQYPRTQEQRRGLGVAPDPDK
jgi:hypothetical protein